MTRDLVERKAARLLADGKLTVLEVTGDRIRATCVGDSGKTWHLGWWKGRWGCQCPSNAFRRGCAHELALKRVVNEPVREPAAGPGPLTASRMRAAQDEATATRNGTRRTA